MSDTLPFSYHYAWFLWGWTVLSKQYQTSGVVPTTARNEECTDSDLSITLLHCILSVTVHGSFRLDFPVNKGVNIMVSFLLLEQVMNFFPKPLDVD